MKHRLSGIFLSCLMYAVYACSPEVAPSAPEFVTGFNVTAEDVTFFEQDTKVNFDSNLGFHWSESGDVLGIFPVGGDQVAFPISDVSSDREARFDGGAWALRANCEYAAYYPFDKANYMLDDMVIPVSYVGQKQIGNDNLAHLGAYAYMMAEATYPSEDGSVNLPMKHLGAIARVTATIPSGENVKEIVLTNEHSYFLSGGDVDLARKHSGNKEYVPVVQDPEYVISVSLAVSGLRTEKVQSSERNVIAYLWMVPQALNGQDITISIVTDKGTYDKTITCGKNLVAGKGSWLDFGIIKSDDPVVTPGTYASRGWFELPAQTDDDHDGIDDLNPDMYYSWTMRADAPKVRNFSSGYSSGKRHPVWVAAPMHQCYLGNSGRNEAYRDDPGIGCVQSGKFTGYTRGHMVGSSDRTVSVATNKQAFFYSNIGAQMSTGFNTGGGAWNNLEDKVDSYMCSDTLYQVIGCIFEDFTDAYGSKISKKTGTNGYDQSFQVPTAWYKVLLRTKKGNTGKRVDQCTASELQCVAFILAHKSNASHKPSRSDMYTVAELEEMTGLNFFVNVPNAPKDSFSASDWGL